MSCTAAAQNSKGGPRIPRTVKDRHCNVLVPSRGGHLHRERDDQIRRTTLFQRDGPWFWATTKRRAADAMRGTGWCSASSQPRSCFEANTKVSRNRGGGPPPALVVRHQLTCTGRFTRYGYFGCTACEYRRLSSRCDGEDLGEKGLPCIQLSNNRGQGCNKKQPHAEENELAQLD